MNSAGKAAIPANQPTKRICNPAAAARALLARRTSRPSMMTTITRATTNTLFVARIVSTTAFVGAIGVRPATIRKPTSAESSAATMMKVPTGLPERPSSKRRGAAVDGRDRSVELICPDNSCATHLMRACNSVVGMRRFWGRGPPRESSTAQSSFAVPRLEPRGFGSSRSPGPKLLRQRAILPRGSSRPSPVLAELVPAVYALSSAIETSWP